MTLNETILAKKSELAELKERIDRQIVVTKTPSGDSKAKIVL